MQRREASDRASRVEWLLDWNKNTGIDIQQRNQNKLFALAQVAAALAVNMLSVRGTPQPPNKKKRFVKQKHILSSFLNWGTRILVQISNRIIAVTTQQFLELRDEQLVR
jgi:hypothetical protein